MVQDPIEVLSVARNPYLRSDARNPCVCGGSGGTTSPRVVHPHRGWT